MIQAGVDVVSVLSVPSGNGFGDGLQLAELLGRIGLAQDFVGNNG